MIEALDHLGKADRLQRSSSPSIQRDTPGVVKSCRGVHATATHRSDEQIAKVAQQYRVYYAERRTGPGPNDYTMDHSSVLYLMGPDGKFIAPIRADEDGAQMAADLGRLMS